jgi:hypothetical protein
MGSPALTPAPPAGGLQGPPGAGPGAPSPGGGGDKGPVAQRLARLAMDAQGIAGDSPETAPMMREVQNQVRMATMKMIQQKQQTQQMAPQI